MQAPADPAAPIAPTAGSVTQAMFDEYRTKILASFVQTRGMTRHQIESYEYFIHHMLPHIIEENSPLLINCVKQHAYHKLFFVSVRIRKPNVCESNGEVHYVKPKEAHLRKLTYSCDVLVDIRHKVYASTPEQPTRFRLMEHKVYRNVLFGKLPAMVGSSVCNDEANLASPYRHMFGTFICNGYVKCLISQERLKSNYAYVHVPRKNSGELRCEIRSLHDNKIRSTSTLNIYSTTGKNGFPDVRFLVPFIRFRIPFLMVFRLLGVDDAGVVVSLLRGRRCSYRLQHVVQNIVNPAAREFSQSVDVESMLDWIGRRGCAERNRRKRVQYVRHIIRNELLPHVGDDFSSPEAAAATNFLKACTLAAGIRKLLRVHLGEAAPDDIDEQQNKTICPAGNLIGLLLRQLTRTAFKMLHVQIFKAVRTGRYVNVNDFFNHRRITPGINYCFSTGNWSAVRNASSNQTGICQVLNTMNLNSRYSQLRLINTPLNRDGKAPAPRQIQPSQFGIVCAGETPDGRSVGLLNVLAYLAGVRLKYSTRILQEVVRAQAGVHPFSPATALEGTHVCVNGVLTGHTAGPQALVGRLRRLRRRLALPPDVSVFYDEGSDEVVVNGFAMAGYRPLILLENLGLLPGLVRLYGDFPENLWSQLVVHGVVEYIAKDEEAHLYVAMDYGRVLADPAAGFTHLEIEGSLSLYGVSGSCIVYSNHNQAPRNIYMSGMCKQAVAAPPLDHAHKMDTKAFHLGYPQRPLVDTVGSRLLGLAEEPSVQSCVVAVCIDTGFGQEDAIIVKQSSLDRGLFRTYFTRTYRSSEAAHGADRETLGVVGEGVRGRKRADYSKVQGDGTVAPAQGLVDGDVVIGKYSNFTHSTYRDGRHVSTQESRDQSVVAKDDGKCHAERVMYGAHRDKQGLRHAAVRTVSALVPEVGDKLASLHAQKGIIGACVPDEDMIRTAAGMSPDLIINAHSFPSRMTVGQIIESVAGKAAALEGRIADGTPFRDSDMDRMRGVLARAGYARDGTERMYSGKTGELLEHPVFIGVCSYQRLRHVVRSKIHARARGPRTMLTRAPVEGRARAGAFRVGELQMSCLAAHGAAATLRDRLLYNSDVHDCFVCQGCGKVAERAAPRGSRVLSVLHMQNYCRHCDSYENIVPVQIPYAFKLLIDELAAIHIGVSLET